MIFNICLMSFFFLLYLRANLVITVIILQWKKVMFTCTDYCHSESNHISDSESKVYALDFFKIKKSFYSASMNSVD